MQNETGAWELPDELKDLQQVVRRFMKNEVRSAEEAVEVDAWELLPEDRDRLQARARQAGLWCVASPAEYGGAGLSVLAQVVVAEEAAQCRMGLYQPACEAFGHDPSGLIFGGTSAQIERLGVTGVKTGRKTYSALTEPSGGADPARAVETRARLDGDQWIINGTKVFISGADQAEWGVVFARTGEGREGISCFIVETDRPGFTARRIPVIRSWSPCEVHLENVAVPQENLLGEVGRGFELSQRWLSHGRIPYAARAIGVAVRSLELTARYALDRNVFGGPLADKQAIQWMLADSEIELRAARLLVYEAAWKADLGRDFRVEASIAKVYATEVASRVVDRCIQIFGGLGVSKEMPLERWFRELRIFRIGEGPSEVHRMVVSRHLLRQARAARV
jgi:acyl-CoA dehydrogenase